MRYNLKKLFLNAGLMAIVAGVAMVNPAQAQVGRQMTKCGCADERSSVSGPLEDALKRYTTALAEGDMVTAAQYLSRFTFDQRRRRIYRTRAEQERLLAEMKERRINGFRYCIGLGSTRELAYRSSQRINTIFGCVIYLDKQGDEWAQMTAVTSYNEGGRRVFDPIMAPLMSPSDMFPSKILKNEPLQILAEPPPPLLPMPPER